jgi:hypothetical protein
MVKVEEIINLKSLENLVKIIEERPYFKCIATSKNYDDVTIPMSQVMCLRTNTGLSAFFQEQLKSD